MIRVLNDVYIRCVGGGRPGGGGGLMEGICSPLGLLGRKSTQISVTWYLIGYIDRLLIGYQPAKTYSQFFLPVHKQLFDRICPRKTDSQVFFAIVVFHSLIHIHIIHLDLLSHS